MSACMGPGGFAAAASQHQQQQQQGLLGAGVFQVHRAGQQQAAAMAPPAPAPGGAGPTRSLFVKGLAKQVSEKTLISLFSACGAVADVQIARHRSGRSAGFAIVTFLRHEDAGLATQHMDNLVFLGRKLSVKWFEPARVLGADVAPFAAGLGNLGAADLLALAQLLGEQQPSGVPAPPPAGLKAAPQQQQQAMLLPEQQQQPGWSSMVTTWLDDYVAHQEVSALHAAAGLAAGLPDMSGADSATSMCVITATRPGANAAAEPGKAAAHQHASLRGAPHALDGLDLARLTLAAAGGAFDDVSPTAPSQLTTTPTTPTFGGGAGASASPAAPASTSGVTAPGSVRGEAAGAGVTCSTAPASILDDACSDAGSTHTAITGSDGAEGSLPASASADAHVAPDMLLPQHLLAGLEGLSLAPGSGPAASGGASSRQGAWPQSRATSSSDPGMHHQQQQQLAAAAAQLQMRASLARAGPMAAAAPPLPPHHRMAVQRPHHVQQPLPLSYYGLSVPVPHSSAGGAAVDPAMLQALQLQAAAMAAQQQQPTQQQQQQQQLKYNDYLAKLAAVHRSQQQLMAAAAAAYPSHPDMGHPGAAGLPMHMGGLPQYGGMQQYGSMQQQGPAAGIPNLSTLMMLNNAMNGGRPMGL